MGSWGESIVAGGRPRQYDDPEEFIARSNDYFDGCVKNECPPTLADWAYALGFESVQSIYDYGKDERFSYAIKRGRLRVHGYHERGLSKQSCAGHIFWLKNNAEYSDKQDIGLSTPDGPIQTDNKIEIGHVKARE